MTTCPCLTGEPIDRTCKLIGEKVDGADCIDSPEKCTHLAKTSSKYMLGGLNRDYVPEAKKFCESLRQK